MKKKMVVALLVCAMTVSVLTGCGSKESSAPETEGRQAEVSVERTGKEAAEESGESLTVLTRQHQAIEDYNTNKLTQIVEEKSGVKVQFETIPSEGMEEKLSLILASGDYPDIFFGLGMNSNMELQYGVEDGTLLPLNDLIEEHAPNFKAAIAEFDKGMESLKAVDGNIYSLPVLDVCQHAENAAKMWVNREWLDQIGMDVPTNTDEFYEMLKAFKKNDMNGNGDVGDELPMVGSINGWNQRVETFLMNSFIYTEADNRGFYVEEGKIANSTTDERFREGLRYLHKLYEEGLIYEGSLTQKQEQLKKQFDNPDAALVGAVPGGFPGEFTGILGGERAQMYRPIEPLEGPDGTKQAATYPSSPGQGHFVISKDCKDPVAAIKWADTFYDKEVTLDLRWGLKDEYWKEAGEDEVGFNGKPAIWTSLIPFDHSVVQNDTYLEVGIWYQSGELRAGQSIPANVDMWSAEGNEYMLYKVTEEMYAPYAQPDKHMPKLKLTAEEQTRISEIRTEWNNYYDQMVFDFVSGKLSLDQDWEAHLSQVEKLGMEEALSIYQTAYDRMMS